MKRPGVLFLLSVSGLFAQTLTVSPSRVLLDEAAAIQASGLQAGERVTIRSELNDGAGERWTAQADFLADAQGNLDLSKQAPQAGSYKEVSAMGLVWSMMPASKSARAYAAPRDLGPQTVRFELLRKGQKAADAELVQDAVASGVRRVAVREGPLRGILFLPAGGEKHHAILIVGGSNGGVPARQAAWLASRGFVSFALAYFHYDDLPAQLEEIPLEYFQKGLSWLLARPEVEGNRPAVMGTSRGGELVLQLGSMFPAIAAVVAYVPADVRYPSCCRDPGTPAWMWQGRALPYLLPRLGRGSPMAAVATIAVEQTHGPILMMSGESDGIWHSSEMADDVVRRLHSRNFAYSRATGGCRIE